MHLQARLLSAAIVTALVLPAAAFAAAPTQSPAVQRALGLIDGHGKAFWKKLGQVLPDYERRREDLRQLGAALDW